MSTQLFLHYQWKYLGYEGQNYRVGICWYVVKILEQFSFESGTKDRKELPIALYGHTATVFNDHKMLICGGCDNRVRKTTHES